MLFKLSVTLDASIRPERNEDRLARRGLDVLLVMALASAQISFDSVNSIECDNFERIEQGTPNHELALLSLLKVIE